MRHCILALIVLVSSQPVASQSVRVDAHASRITFKGSAYDVTLIIASERDIASATVKLEILAPSGDPVARTSLSSNLKAGTSRLRTTIPLPQLPKRSQELMWYRLSCSIAANDKEIGKDVLPLLDSVEDFSLHVSAPTMVQAGKKFFVRVHTNNPVAGKPVGGVGIRVTVANSDKDSSLAAGSGTIGANGYVIIPLTIPADITTPTLTLTVEARHGAIRKEAESELKLGAPTQILVQTDKPLYQPGQTLHVRALVFGDEHRAVPHKKIYLQIEDEDGTTVFRDERYSSRFGVISLDWAIPDRLRLGEYMILAKTYPGRYVESDEDSDDEEENALTSAMDRRVVRISRYELPTFVVNAKSERNYYLPDQKASIEVNAAYLFGKPVPSAKVRVSRLEERKWDFARQRWDVEEGEPITGTTDEQGNFHGVLDIAKDFSELDEESYRKFRDVTYTAYVTDPTSGRTEERRFDVRVSKYPIHVYFVGNQSSAHGLPSQFFLSASYADGSAAQCEVEVRTVDSLGEHLLASAHTNRYGVARLRGAKAVPEGDKELALILVARDRKGFAGVTKLNVWQYPGEHALEVVPTKTILAAGDAIEAELQSDADGGVLVELTNSSRILRSSTVRVKNHRAMVRFPYSPEFKGELAILAMNMNASRSSGFPRSRSVIYPENRDLKIALKLDQKQYRPGQPAAATVQVKTADGAAIPSVIGAVIFDKAVEERARIDEDLRYPFGFGGYSGWWYQGAKLANLTRADLDRVDTSEPVSEDLDVAADFLLNADGGGGGFFYSPTFGDDETIESPGDVYRTEIQRTLGPLLTAIYREVIDRSALPRSLEGLNALLARHQLNGTDFKDPWGIPFFPKFSVGYQDYELELISSGPDRVSGTDDDFSVAHVYLNFYQAIERKVTEALKEYHRQNGTYVRDATALSAALALVGVDLSKVRDPWGNPYIFEFGISGAQYTVSARTQGSGGKPGQEYLLGTSAVDYFEEPRVAISKVLNPGIQRAGKLPETEQEFKNLLLPDFRLDDLRDPFGRPYIVRLSAVATYSDKVVAYNQQVETEPVTVWNRLYKVRSAGPDGIADTADDFDVATFAALLSEVTVSGKTSKATMHLMFTGETGGITGTVTDPTGAALGNTKVVAANEITGTKYEATTDSNGRYVILSVPPGIYKISVSASGFQQAVWNSVVVRAQEAVEVDASLRLGSTTETVEVSAASLSVQTSSAEVSGVIRSTNLTQQASVTPRLREYFPETLLWQPSIETDTNGKAHITWKFADNLTTWKMSLIASTLDGRLATLDKEVKSFQPFFVEHDPPKALTIGDRISLPVVVRNYTDKAERVRVEMRGSDWFELNSTASQEAAITPGGNAKLIFPFKATSAISSGKQRVTATGTTVADAIERAVAVHPDGAELTRTDGRIISGAVSLEFEIPKEAISGSIRADLKIYPDLLAQVTESLEGMLQRPWGCGEQTISSTYPSVLLLQFEKQSRRSLGSLHDRALRYTSLGYTRLLSYIDDSGGVTYWGRGEPDVALTAYALQFLNGASEFISVDPSLIDKARKWLVQQQTKGGSWASEHWYQHSPLQDAILTAYVAQSLALTRSSAGKNQEPQKQSEMEDAALHRGLDYVESATKNYRDPYLFALYGLAEIASGQSSQAESAIEQLRTSAAKQRTGSYWELLANTPFYGWGHAGRVETTALVVRLLDRAGHPEDKELTTRGLEFLIEEKDRYGAWYSTQTTVNVVEALLLLASKETEATQAAFRILVNGSPQTLPSNMEQTLAPQVLDISQVAHPGKNTIEISGGSGKLTSIQTVQDYYVRWDSPLATPKAGPLKLSVSCDRTHLAVSDKATCEVLAERVGSAGHGMMIAEIGIPPGVDVDREALQKQVSESGWDLSSFDILPDRLEAYIWPRAGGTKFSIIFTPRMAVDALTAPHSLYDYYNPDANVTVAPDRFLVVEPASVAER
ncbi:MAG TPA: MG2 domain-containing protein [Terriglobales bacterium]|nr:MG2 domain-containing protein [Terriglobales bacterium]